MLSSLFSGASGLQNHVVRMDVIGNNIANINTTGFKRSRTTFQEALIQTLRGAGRPSAITGGTNPIQRGLGMTVASIDNIFTQGGLETSGQITDLAIQGAGFFILSDGNQDFYSRAGSFGFDANSDMVNTANGLYVQGTLADATGVIPAKATVGNIRLPFGQQDPAKETSFIELANNINSVATTSTASLQSGGATNIDRVFGQARDGAGGSHAITVSGNQATQSSALSALTGGVLTGSETLQSLGVTAAGLAETTSISVDNGATETPLTGLTLTSTVNDLVLALNKIQGVECELDGGDIRVTRTYAGEGANRNVSVESSLVAAPAGETIVGALFDATATFDVNNGLNHTMTATDVFTPSNGLAQPPLALGLEINETTGLVSGITGLGSGNVTVESSSALAAGSAIITTDDTEYSTSLSVYDSQGGKHTLVLTFTKSFLSNQWSWDATLAGSEQALYGDSGEVTFNGDGSLASFDYDGGNTSLGIDPKNGAALMDIRIDAGTAGRFDGLTGFASTSTASIINQDGYGLGILNKIAIDPTGQVLGIFTNGVTRTLAQIVLADFSNEQGLRKNGQSLYQESANSGEAAVGVAGETIPATISSGALEASNVDLAQEFTGMIIAQRGFQANARVITTSDSMLDELVNLKR
ncbi:MAG: flagellar hook-basal body complex protein [candidate division Zixibacteria bacterium]|nr:flagellar hook-basal body complex protein [candidate division Zixibacteria bacterium]